MNYKNQEPYHEYISRKYKETEMSDLTNHLIALKNKHHDLDKRIEVLIAEHAPEQTINNLKKQKLAIKDEMVKIEKSL